MNARQRRDKLLMELATLDRYSMAMHVITGKDAERDADLEYLESKRKVHRAEQGDGWALWRLGKG
jgi:hypothetical protein